MIRRSTSWTERVHPLLWWTWGGLVSVAGATAPLPAQLAVMAGCALVVLSICNESAARKNFFWSVYFAASLVLLRVTMQLLLGTSTGPALIGLPQFDLPGGISLLGPVSAAELQLAVNSGLRLAVVVIGIASAAAICPPSRLLATLPGQLQDLALLLNIATTFLPNLAADARRLARARRWRGETGNRLSWVLQQAVPLVEAALVRSLQVGASISLRRPLRIQRRAERARRLLAVLALTAGSTGWIVGGAVWLAFASALVAALLLVQRPRFDRLRPLQLPRWSAESARLAALLSSVALLNLSVAGGWLTAGLAFIPLAAASGQART